MEILIDALSSWDNFITFVFVVAAFYGVIWIIGKIGESLTSSRTRKYKYDFYDREKPRKPDDPIITKVVGVTFEGRQNIVRKLIKGEKLELVPEPSNPHDQNAIKVIRKSGEQVGYIERQLAKDLGWVFKASIFNRPAEVLEVIGNESKGQSLGVIIKIYPPSREEVLASSEFFYPPF